MEKKPSSFVSKDEFQTEEQVPFVKSEAEVKFVKKMNMRFIPFVCVILFLQVNLIYLKKKKKR
jgi:hypothetical protein